MRVGDRIVLQGTHRGTIRYIGSVPNQAGEWTGVEWDDASRGKHDGCVAGQRLFTCQRPGTPATFVRSRKLVESLLPVMSLLEGLRERYCRDEAPSLDLPSPGQHPKGRGVVVMGRADLLAAASDLTMLAHASVLGMHVAARDPPDDLSQALPSLQDLDAGDTLLGSWHAAATALSSLPALRTLSLAGTRLEAVPALPPPPPLPALRTLVLSSTGVGWGGALRIGRSLPSLAALCLCDESVEDVSPAEKGECDLTATFPALESLDLSGNLLASWRQVAALATLPSLQTLNLTGNPWGSSGDDSDCAVPCPPGFRTLRTLLLGGTRVSSWSQVQALDGLPALASLRLTDTPLWTRAPATARAQTIARLGGLVQLNGSQVAAEERRDAELWYLRKVTDELAASPQDKEGVLACHPRYPALLQALGAPAPALASRGTGPGSSRLLEIALHHEERVVIKRLPESLTVQRLRALIERLMGVPAAAQRLVLETGEGHEDISAHLGRQLAAFSITPGSRIMVSSVNPDQIRGQQALQAARAHDALERRMMEQENHLQHLHLEERRLMG
ncbi:TFCE1 [Auxenochlorella protothecoides x Auxenochlorella symbiontica]|uniref:Uncharacterized protein n=1 Tax=Auxenochlorella protothecoides TaxID=3075 RepID=A0A1D2AC75_AUXPR